MEKYKVVREFKETKHDGHVYVVGDSYPKEGEKATKARLEELSTTKNKYKKVYIEEVVNEEQKVEKVEGTSDDNDSKVETPKDKE